MASERDPLLQRNDQRLEDGLQAATAVPKIILFEKYWNAIGTLQDVSASSLRDALKEEELETTSLYALMFLLILRLRDEESLHPRQPFKLSVVSSHHLLETMVARNERVDEILAEILKESMKHLPDEPEQDAICTMLTTPFVISSTQRSQVRCKLLC